MKRLIRKSDVVDFEFFQKAKQVTEKLEEYMSVLDSYSVVNTHELNHQRQSESINDYELCKSLINRLKQQDSSAIEEANQLINETARNIIEQLRNIIAEYEKVKGQPGREGIEDDIEYFNETIRRIESGDIEVFKDAFEIIA